MKLSVLIPTYDYKCYTLVNNLHTQLEQCGEDYEVIVMDDGGHDQVCAISNHRINDLSNCQYIRNKVNVGRAHNCNKLINQAKGEWCLIIDCDAKVVNEDYIANYIKCFRDNPEIDIVSGDLVNPPAIPSPEVSLRYRYEKKAEPHRLASYRNQHPFKRFNTFNVAIKRQVLLEIPFDEDCTEYGFEDALMGVEFEKHGKHILHIDNPLMHMGFDSNNVYLAKVETSLKTLKKLGDRMVPYTGFGKAISKLHTYHSVWVVKVMYTIIRPLLRKNLLGKNPNMNIFGFYKLGYFLSLR